MKLLDILCKRGNIFCSFKSLFKSNNAHNEDNMSLSSRQRRMRRCGRNFQGFLMISWENFISVLEGNFDLNDGCPSPAPPKSGCSSWMTPSDRQLKISIKICNTKFQRQSSDPKYQIKINFPFVSSTYSRSKFNFKKFLHKNRILLVTDQKCIQFEM